MICRYTVLCCETAHCNVMVLDRMPVAECQNLKFEARTPQAPLTSSLWYSTMFSISNVFPWMALFHPILDFPRNHRRKENYLICCPPLDSVIHVKTPKEWVEEKRKSKLSDFQQYACNLFVIFSKFPN